MKDDLLYHSDTIPGADGNYHWPMKADRTSSGFVGITQDRGDGEEAERILLSRKQYKALVEFVEKGWRRKRS